MDEKVKKVTVITVVTTVFTTLICCKLLIYNRLQRWLRRLRPFSHLIFILIINSVLNRILHSYFFLCVELKNYRNGCNQAVNKLKFNYLQFDEVVTEVATVVTKSHNYIQINKLRVVTKNEQLV